MTDNQEIQGELMIKNKRSNKHAKQYQMMQLSRRITKSKESEPMQHIRKLTHVTH